MPVDTPETVLLLHMEGADASTTFTDESGKTVTANGNAQIDTAQSKFGGSAMLCDGTEDWITAPDSADFYFNGNFTVDFWIRCNSTVTTRWCGQWTDGNNGWRLYNVDATDMRFDIYSSGSLIVNITAAHGMSVDTWYHIALVKNGTTYTIYKNGTSIGSTTDADVMANYTGTFGIGYDGNSSTSPLNGWIDEFRVSKGIARWTANFTPPSAPYGPPSNFFF